MALLARHKALVLGTALLVVAATAAFVFLVDPVYRATSLVYVEQQASPQLSELLGVEEVSRNVKNEVEIIGSRALAAEVAGRLLREAEGAPDRFTILQDDDKDRATLDEVVERLREDYVVIAPAGLEVDLIRIHATSTVPGEAQWIANTYAAAYQDYNRTSSRTTMAASRAFFGEVAAQYSRQLEEAEAQLGAFLDQERMAEPEGEVQQLLGQVGDLQSTQYRTRLALGTAEAELRGLEQAMEQATTGLAGRLSSNDDVMIDRLKEEMAALQIEQEQIYAQYPALRARAEPPEGRLAEIERETAELSVQLRQRALRLAEAAPAGAPALGTEATGSAEARLEPVQALRRRIAEKDIEVRSLRARLGILSGELTTFQGRLAEIPGKALTLQRLERTQQAQERIYLSLLEKMQEARVAEQSELGYVRVVDEAPLPDEPFRPRRALSLALSLVLGTLLGAALAVARGTLETTVEQPDDLEARGFHVLGVVPPIAKMLAKMLEESRGRAPDAPVPTGRLSGTLDAFPALFDEYSRMATNIRFARPAAPPAVIMITSAEPEEGKTTTALNLAVATARSGARTLLIDADLHTTALTDRAGSATEHGLVDVVATGEWDLARARMEGLYFLPAGRRLPRQPGEVLGSRRMADLLRVLRERFEVIILDTPPVLGVADPLLLASHCDAIVLSAFAGRTNLRAVEHAAEALLDAGGEIVGAVLNGPAGFPAYPSYGYSHYPRYDRTTPAARPGDGVDYPALAGDVGAWHFTDSDPTDDA